MSLSPMIGLRPIARAVAVASSLLLLAPGVQATNGYFQHGFGAHSKGMAGAGSALPQDLLSIYNNPAGLSMLDEQVNIGVEFFSPDRQFVANDDFARQPNGFPAGPFVPPGENSSENTLFVIPSFGMSWKLDDKSAVALTMLGNGGLNTEYKPNPWRFFAEPAGSPPRPPDPATGFPGSPGNPTGDFTAGNNSGIDLVQVLVGATYSRKVFPNLWSDTITSQSIGITPLLAVQRFKANGLQPFKPLSKHPDKLTNNGYDYSYGGGIKVGYLATLWDRLNLGVSYQSEQYMTRLDKYKGLLAKNGSFNIPSMFKAGLAYKLLPSLTLVGDYTWIEYSAIDAVNNTNDLSFGNVEADPNRLLGGSDGLGFGWDNVNIWHVGLQWEYDSMWTFRTGYSHGDEPWNNVDTLFNVLAPATIQDHASIGLSVRPGKHSELTFAYTHAFKNTIQGTSQFTGTQTGNVDMKQNDFELLWTYKF